MLRLVRDPLDLAIRGLDSRYEVAPNPHRKKDFYYLVGKARAGYDIKAYLGWEPSGRPDDKRVLHWGNEVTAQILMSLESKFGIQPVFLNATEHAFLNGKGTKKEISQYAEIMTQEVNKLFTSPTIISGDEFQLGTYDNHKLKDKTPEELRKIIENINLYRKIVENGLTLPKSELEDAASEVVTPESAGSAFLYAVLQWADIHYLDETLNVKFVTAGPDQKKMHRLVWKYFDRFEYEKPVFIHGPLLLSLSGRLVSKKDAKGNLIPGTERPAKMSKSEGEEYTLYLSDLDEDIERKFAKAYCPPYAPVLSDKGAPLEFNPQISLITNVINHHCKTLKIERALKFGGDIEGEPLEVVEWFKKGEIHPLDLKNANMREMKKLNKVLGIQQPAEKIQVEE